jgi:hypothetical protein
MFLLLIVISLSHQVYYSWHEKLDEYPARSIFLRLIEMMGRIAIFPIVLFYFLSSIKMDSQSTELIFTVLGILIPIVIFYREAPMLRAVFSKSLKAVIEKAAKEETTLEEMTYAEIFLINWNVFHVISFKPILISTELREKHTLEWKSKYDTKLTDTHKIKQKLGQNEERTVELTSNTPVAKHVEQPSDSDDELQISLSTLDYAAIYTTEDTLDTMTNQNNALNRL